MNTLEVKNLFFHYDGQPVLKDITFEYNKKDFLSIIGPNGGGKSTLLKIILGLLKQDSGTIFFQDNINKKAVENIGYVPQDININKYFPIDVLDVVVMGRLHKTKFGFYTKEDRAYSLAMLEEVGMSDFYKRRIGELSGGQRQRVFIARALACESEILVLDEPTASIDIEGQVKIFEILKTLNSKKGVIVVSHDVNIAMGYSTKIAYLNKSLFMHDSSPKTKEALLKTLKNNNDHFCEVELLMATTCTHESSEK